MTTDIGEFAQEFFQEIISDSDARGEFTEDIFFEKFCDHLMAAGEIDSADRAAYQSPPRQGIRVDGYGGEPDSGCLSLIVSDFHQSPDISRLSGTEMDRILERPSRFLRKVFDSQWRNALEETSPAFGLADLVCQRWAETNRVRLFLISNRELSSRIDGRVADAFDGRTVSYSVWDIRRLHRFATMGHGREDIEIDLEKDFGAPLPVLPAHQSKGRHESYLVTVPGIVLAEIYDRWGARLLEQNVRVFLQARGKVNRGIRKTIETEPAMFFAYNNGLTTTAESVSLARSDGSLLLRRIKNFQVVNGGQTMASIHAAHRGKKDMSEVFVQMKLSVVDAERAAEIVPSISEFANTQNRVSAADFFANHPFHVRIEEFSRRIFAPSPDGTFRESKWFYERARGQYADARALLTQAARKKFDLEYPRSQLFSKTDIAKYVNVWQGKPHTVSLGAQKNFADFASAIGREWEKDADRFSETWYREAVAKAIIFRAAERIVSNQAWYQGGFRANVVAYAIAKMGHDIGKSGGSVNFEAVWKCQSASSGIEAAITLAGGMVHEILTSPPEGISNITEWAKKQACWERVRALSVTWPIELADGLMSAEEKRSAHSHGRRGQKMLNGIQAQMAVVKAGSSFWTEALAWGREQELLTAKEIGIVASATQIPTRIPSEAQSVKVMDVLGKLRDAGYPRQL